jgi:uncharacterized protein (TIGR02996 family)
MIEQAAFLEAIKKNEDDTATRLVYADWLDEHDEPEEADRMRRWQASKQWLLAWARSVNYGKWECDEDGNYLKDESGSRVPAKKDNLGDPHAYEDVIEAGHAVCRGEVYCWGSDAAQDYFFTKDYRSGDGEKVREWLSHWSTVTGIVVPNLDRHAKRPPFRCAC